MQLKRKAVVNHDWVGHQARSLLQYFNVITNLFKSEKLFNKPHEYKLDVSKPSSLDIILSVSPEYLIAENCIKEK